MLRRLFRLLIIVVLLGVIAFAVSKLMGGEDDDFDDFEDLDAGFEFQETPVEIEVPANEASVPAPEQSSASTNTATLTDTVISETAAEPQVETERSTTESAGSNGNGGRLIDIIGIGPAYEARLHSIGINSISDLAHADANSIASQIEVIGGASTVDDWINQAKSYSTGGQS